MPVSSFPDLSYIKRFAQDNLASHLQFFEGKKDLILDEELMKPLDIIAGISFLKTYNAEKIYKLQDGHSVTGNEKRIFIIRPYIDRMKLLAESINADKQQGISRQYHVVFTPKKLSTSDMILEQEGVYGDVTMDEFPLDMIPLDNDILSLEMPLCFKEFFMNEEMTWLHIIARALSTLQGLYGVIPKGTIVGNKSKMLQDLTTLLRADQNDFYPMDGLPIGSFIMLDRDIDLVSMLCSQLTYEGLVAENFGITSGIVEFGKDVTGTDQKARLTLNSTDQVFSEIRGMHVNTVFPLLSQKAKQLQCVYEKRNDLQSVQDMKQYVNEDLKSLKLQQKSLSLHIGACEKISKNKAAEDFEDILNVEHCIIEDSQYKDNVSFVETCINRQKPITLCLRLLCMLSLCRGGLDTKLYKSLKLQFLQSFGYYHMLTFKHLNDVGLFTESNNKRNVFPKIRKKFSLIPKDPEKLKTSSPKDISYVFGGAYSPFLCKLVELILTRGTTGWLEDTLRSFQIPTYDYKHATSARQSGTSNTIKLSNEAQKTVLIIINGGCTHTEINAIRFIGKQLGHRFIILTTSIYSSQDFLATLTPT